MKKLIIICLVLLFILSSIFASETRIQSLGLNAQYFIKDYNNVKLFPTALEINPNVAFVDGQFQKYMYGGLHYKIIENLYLGLRLSSERIEIAFNDLQTFAQETEDGYTLLFGYRINERLTGGFQFTHKGSRYSYENDLSSSSKLKENTSWNELVLGVRMQVNPQLEAEGSLRFIKRSFESKRSGYDPEVQVKPDGHSTLQIDGRAFYELTEIMYLAPYFNLTLQGEGAKYEMGKINRKTRNFLLGVAHVIKPDDETAIFGGIGLRINNSNTEEEQDTLSIADTKNNHFTFPFFNGGAEAALSKYFTLRFSFFKNLTSVTHQQPLEWIDRSQKEEEKFSQKNFGVLIGGQMQFKNYKIDLVFGDNVFGRDPWFSYYYIGESGTVAWFSVTYNFDEIIK